MCKLQSAIVCFLITARLPIHAQLVDVCTVEPRLFEVVGTIFTNQNYTKCQWDSHFGWFWLVKIAPVKGYECIAIKST